MRQVRRTRSSLCLVENGRGWWVNYYQQSDDLPRLGVSSSGWLVEHIPQAATAQVLAPLEIALVCPDWLDWVMNK